MRRRRTSAVVVDRTALRRKRQLRGLGQDELAVLAGVSPSYVGHIESGRRPTISPRVFVRICDALGVEDRTELMAS
jgi:transcriptional regulator with XRE-family HTH domain